MIELEKMLKDLHLLSGLNMSIFEFKSKFISFLSNTKNQNFVTK